MEIRFLGTGNPFGLPAPGCDCETCSRARTLGVERTRSSVQVHNERTGETLQVDVGPDWWYQHVRDGVELVDEVVVTHAHYDHVGGLPNTGPFYETLPVHAAEPAGVSDEESVAEQVRSKYGWCWPLQVRDHEPFVPFESCGFRVTFAPVVHGDTPCFGVAITDPVADAKVAITSDTCYRIPAKTRECFDAPDLLVTEALCPADAVDDVPPGRNSVFTMPEGHHPDEDGVARSVGEKHMTHEGAHALAEDLNADRVRLVHTTHYYPAGEAFDDSIANDGDRLSV